MKTPCVYILTSKPNGTLYVGVTSNLQGRVYAHRNHLVDGFTMTHGIDRLVWYEVHQDIREAIAREKRIKGWKRTWKVQLIEKTNPDWNDLYTSIL